MVEQNAANDQSKEKSNEEKVPPTVQVVKLDASGYTQKTDKNGPQEVDDLLQFDAPRGQS